MRSEAPSARIIWITPKFPLGNPDGARHATCQLVRHLSALNVEIDLVCLVREGEAVDEAAAKNELGVHSCSIIRRSSSRFFPLPHWGIPFTFRTFTHSRIRKRFKHRLKELMTAPSPFGDLPPYIVFDGLHTSGVLEPKDLRQLARTARGIIYRAHNVETELWDQCVLRAGTPWTRAFFRHQAMLVRNFEREVVRQATWTATVSEEDARRFQSIVPGAAIYSTPIGIDMPGDEEIPAVSKNASFELLFVGRLDWLPNREGLRWFLDNVWSSLKARRPAATLNIVGIGDGRWLSSYKNLPGLQILGFVPAVRPLYESCVLTLAPIFQGSGTRVKILEAARFKRAALTTALGSEGSGLIPGDSCFHAESREAWLSALEHLTIQDCRKVGENAATAVREQFDGKSVAERFLQRLVSPVPEEILTGAPRG